MGRSKLGKRKQRSKQKWKKRQQSNDCGVNLCNSSEEAHVDLKHECDHQCAESNASDDTFGSPTSALAELEELGLLDSDIENEGGYGFSSSPEVLNSHLQDGLLYCKLPSVATDTAEQRKVKQLEKALE